MIFDFWRVIACHGLGQQDAGLMVACERASWGRAGGELGASSNGEVR